MKVYYCSKFDEIHLILPVNKWLCATLIDSEWVSYSLPRENWYYIGEYE